MNDKSLRLGDLAKLTGGTLVGDPDVRIRRVAAVDDCDEDSLTFAVDERYLSKALRSRTPAILVPERAREVERNGKTFLVVANVRAALAAILGSFAPQMPHGEFTHQTALLEAGVTREADVWIGPNVVVREGAFLGRGTIFLAGAYVGKKARIGASTLLHPHAIVLDDCVIGEQCVLNANCVVGSEGFGFVWDGEEQIKIPQIGNAVVGNRVEIGACTTIDRAVTGSTTIGDGAKIDNLVQIGHNVSVGDNSMLCAQNGIAGSTKIGKRVISAGQVGVVDHVDIGDGCVIGAGSKVIGSWPANTYISGHYALQHREDLEQKVLVRKLPKLFEQVRELMKAHEASRKSS